MDPQPVFAWALDPARDDDDEAALVSALADHVIAAGVPLSRMTTSFRPLDPEVFVRAVGWRDGVVRAIDRKRPILHEPEYIGSPAHAIHLGSPEIHERVDPARPSRYALVDELAAAGITDYVIKPIELDRTQRTFISYASRSPLTDAHLAYLAAIHPAISTVLRLRSLRMSAAALARTYLGANAAQRVLAGAVERGRGEYIQAAIWFCDLRDYTRLSHSLPAEELLRLLDTYFETVADPIGEHGGDVLKFIGDAILAIFPVADAPAEACTRALAAAEAALERFAAALGEHAIGIGLHFGDVFYGNIGARDRLDFTVIGPAVNVAARVQGQCKAANATLLATGDVARLVGRGDLVSVGTPALKGVASPPELFTLARFRA